MIKHAVIKSLAPALAVVCALAACQGTRDASTLPWAQNAGAIGARASGTNATERLEPQLARCSQTTAPIPGTYVFMTSTGNVHGSTYRQIAGNWVVGTVQAVASPSPMASGNPPTPTQKTYLYVGTYHLKTTGQSGCVYLETTLKGEPFRESSNNASFAGIPDFGSLDFTFNVKKAGRLSMAVKRLGATGGRGTLQLLHRKAVYDTGTVLFTKRILHRGP